MPFKLFLVCFFLAALSFHGQSATITFLHKQDTEISLKDAAYPEALDFKPKFKYLASTVFEFEDANFHLYQLVLNNEKFYLWIKDISEKLVIDLEKPDRTSINLKLYSENEWYSQDLLNSNPDFNELREIELYYASALDSLKKLARTDERFRAENNYNTIVWDSRSARQLYNFAVEQFAYEFDEKWIHSAPSYRKYWQMMYTLYYQYYHKNAFKGIEKGEIKLEIENEFGYPESRLMVFHHFFREGLPLSELQENLLLLQDQLDAREKKLAEAFVQNRAVKDVSYGQKIEFLFGIDIDNALKSYYARDTTGLKNVLVFWSRWEGNILTEFNLLAELKRDFKEEYNFIHICVDAVEAPEKTKALLYQNRVGGFHLLPEQSNAFRNSEYRKALKIRDLPFYVVTDSNGKIIGSESIELVTSERLKHKLDYYSTKK